VGGYYLLLDAFDRPTGERAFVERGGLMPSAPRPQRWRLKDAAEDSWMDSEMPQRRPFHAAQTHPSQIQLR
jgi:hypothetical protein